MYYFRYGDKVTKCFFGRLIIIAWTIFGVTFIGLIISFLSEAVVHSAQYSNRSITATKVRKREIYDRLFCPLNLYSSNNRLQSLREKCPNTEFFLVPIFLHWDQKKLSIWTLFTQRMCILYTITCNAKGGPHGIELKDLMRKISLFV